MTGTPPTVPDSPGPSPSDSTLAPMSYEQESIWLNDQFQQGGTGRYVESWTHRLYGRLDESAVRAALDGVVARHEPLRTALILEDGRPVQRVAPPAPVPLTVRPISADELADAVRAAVSGPLPADRPPLLRATLLRTAPDDAVLAVALHHAAIDGWSLRLLDEEFGELYTAAVEGRPHRLPELPTTFTAYARSRRPEPGPGAGGGWDGTGSGPALEYWRRTLAGAPAESAFPLDRPRPAIPDHRGGRLEFGVPPELAEALRAACRTLRTTPFTFFTAALTALLVRLGGQDDVVLGTPVTRRDRLELEPLVACLSDVMPLRARLRPGQTFRELVRESTATVRGALAHRHVPHSRLVAELAGERVPGRFPLFQVVFTVDDADAPGLRLPGVTAERLHPHNGTAKFDVFLELVPLGRDGGYRGLLEYATGVLDAATAARLAERLLVLLADAVRNPDTPVDELPVLPEAERALVAGELPQGGALGTVPPPHAHELVARAARRHPATPAVLDGERTLTYAELDAAAGALARRLTALGATGRRVGVRIGRSAEAVVALLAVARAGAASVPLDPALPAVRRALIVRDSDMAALLTTRTAPGGEEEDGALPVLWVEDFPHGCANHEGAAVTTADEDLAYVVYTSGSTGRPKGVAMPHRSLAALLDWQTRHSTASAGSRTLQFAPIGFDVAFQEVFATLAVGGTLVVADDATRADPDRLLDLVERHAVERLFLPYVALQQLAEHTVSTGRSAAALREVVTAGEQLYVTPAIRAFFTRACPQARLENQYGPSETHVVTRHPLTGAPDHWPDRPPIGRPVPGSAVHVLDDRMRPCPIGVAGQICVTGDAVAAGYLSSGGGDPAGDGERPGGGELLGGGGLPGGTAERFVPDPFAEETPGHGRRRLLYRTGDKGRWLADGTLHFLGRDDDQVKIRGYRVEPGEVEAALKTVPGVTDAVVHAADQRLLGYYTAADGSDPGEDPIREALRARLPHYLVPAVLVRVPRMPLTATGKTDRAEVHRRYGPGAAGPATAAGGGGAPALPPTGPAGVLATLWAEVLGSDRIEPDQTFFGAGGDSLLAVRLSVRLREELGVDIRPADILTAPTLGSLTALAAVRGQAAASPRRVRGGRPPLGSAPQPALPPEVLPEDIRPAPAGPSHCVEAPLRHVLLTGATGFLGAFLLHELLERTGAVVHCLVRSPGGGLSDPGCHKRLRAVLERYGLWNEASAHRVRAVPGDLAQPLLGLGRERFEELARTADLVVHAGAEVNLTYGYRQLRAANVAGTAEVLRLAAAYRTVPIHHVSTVGVFPAAGPPTGPVAPDHPLGDVGLLRNGYAESKWMAERLVQQARERGLPVSVHRPARISGSSVTGACQSSDFLWLLLKGCVEAGAAPSDYVSEFDLVPVDHVAGAIAALATAPASRGTGGTFHLASGRPRLFTAWVEELRRLGYRLRDLPLDAWHRTVEGLPGNAAYPLLGLLPRTAADGPGGGFPRFDPDAALRALRGTRVAPAEVDRELFERYVRFFVREGFLPAPRA
ncbi:thioester reductase domain-containing protein [Streptomyces sp. NPDC046887]|uniref:non-ribosomal peptide synthetase n=1 Tax=Streptomyces sp. NPDC046887 TaxID=3155472 RepID=UPI0033E03AC8